MTSQLIPVFNGTIANETTLLVNARDLHTFLGVGKRFASWITERIAEYGFVENQDYILVSPNREIKGRGGDRRSKDYHLTSTQPKKRRWLSVTKKAARSAATSSSAKRNFATFSQYKLSCNSQPRKSSSSATCNSGWKKPRTSANTCIRS